jgi:hypothetical protein
MELVAATLDPVGAEVENGAVSKQEIDRYLGTLDEPKRATLAQLRDTIAAIVPDAEQCISYGMPAFKLGGKTIAGFAAFKNHLSYLPHSGSPGWLSDGSSGDDDGEGKPLALAQCTHQHDHRDRQRQHPPDYSLFASARLWSSKSSLLSVSSDTGCGKAVVTRATSAGPERKANAST